MKKLLLLLTLTSSQLLIAQTTIGWNASCTYNMNTNPNSLQQAIDDGMTDIRLTNENDFVTNIVIDDNLSIKGGYNDCANAQTDTQSNINTVIDGSSIAITVIRISSVDNADILINQLTIKNGTGEGMGSPLDNPGGVGILDTIGSVTISHSIIKSNNGVDGGAIKINNYSETPLVTGLTLTFEDTLIEQNTSTGIGGGLSCKQFNSPVTIVLNQGTSIRNNHSASNGGGIINDGCVINFFAGISQQANTKAEYELYKNTSDRNGGGYASFKGIVNFLGDTDKPFDIIENESGLVVSNSGSGGGIIASGSNSIVNLSNTFVTANETNRYGAGLFASSNATINVTSTNNCTYDDYCSKINNNFLLPTFPGGGAAITARSFATINVFNTLITENNADNSAYIGYITGGGKILLEGNLIIKNGLNASYQNDNAFYIRHTDSKLTFAYNTLQENHNVNTVFFIDSSAALDVFGNIINEASNITFTQASSIINISCNMINDVSSISDPMTDTIVDTADYINEAGGNYRLAKTSTNAIDVCDNSLYLPIKDLGGMTRGIDEPSVFDLNGTYDLGAYEYLFIEEIFKDSFE